MDKKSSMVILGISTLYLIIAFLYIIFAVQPALYFHHVQPPFLLSTDFLSHYFEYPGGFSELAANFFMQSFFIKYLGPVVFFSIALAIMWLIYAIMNSIYSSKLNIIWALAPFTFNVVLANNYDFPFSITISIVIVLLLLLLLAKIGKGFISHLVGYLIGAIIIYYLCGSGYMLLFSICAPFFTVNLKMWARLTVIGFILTFALLFPLVVYNFIFATPSAYKYFYFFAHKLNFMAYKQSGMFFTTLLSVPFLLAITSIVAKFKQYRNILKQHVKSLKLKIALSYVVIFFVAFYSHQATYQADEKKIVESDYYCYNNDVENTREASATIEKYDFSVNLNYNLVMSKVGRLTDSFFGFFQKEGTNILHPDYESPERRLFIAADFYYNLGYMSEARHCAYESLVFYPYSLRALQILVKIHLITREYNAAERCLKILNKGLLDRYFVRKYTSYINDTSLTNTDKEIVEKRSFIPAEHELSPFIIRRFQELLETNHNNKCAYEHLMLYYLLDSQLENFMKLYKDAGKYFNKPVEIYEEAILMYGDQNNIPVQSLYKIRPATVARFNDFKRTLKLYEGKEKLAREVLYPQYGKSYMYYLQLIYPHVLKTEILEEDDKKPSI
jgi:hypothetical protein